MRLQDDSSALMVDGRINCFGILEIISLHFVTKHLRHQDAKMNSNRRFPLCLGAFVAICSGLAGLGIKGNIG